MSIFLLQIYYENYQIAAGKVLEISHLCQFFPGEFRHAVENKKNFYRKRGIK